MCYGIEGKEPPGGALLPTVEGNRERVCVPRLRQGNALGRNVVAV